MTCKDCVHYEACKEMYEAYKQDSADYDRDFDDCGFVSCCNLFKNKADFVEVKHGEWREQTEYYDDDYSECNVRSVFVCSLCGRTEIRKEPYCNCGADMRKEGADNG